MTRFFTLLAGMLAAILVAGGAASNTRTWRRQSRWV